MSESPQYEAFRAFARAEIAHQVLKATTDLKEILIREAPKVVEGPPGPKGDTGESGKDSTVPGPKGDPGELGKPGERGADGIATREEMLAEIEKRVAEINVRTFADTWQGTYKNGELYKRGVLTTWGGAVWLSLAETRGRPGEIPDWKLVVKK